VIKVVAAGGGSGKTLYMVGRSFEQIQPKLKEKRRIVVSSIAWKRWGRYRALMKLGWCKTIAESRAYVAKWFVDLDDTKVRRFWEYSPKRAFIVLDEASHHWSAWKRREEPQFLHDIAREHRKPGWDIFLITHHCNCLDTIWRYSTDSYIRLRNLSKGLFWKMRVPGTFVYSETQDENGTGEPLDAGIFRLDMVLAKAYDTAKGATAQGDFADMADKPKGFNAYIVGPLILATAAFMLWGGVSAIQYATQKFMRREGTITRRAITAPTEQTATATGYNIVTETSTLPIQQVPTPIELTGLAKDGMRVTLYLKDGGEIKLKAHDCIITKTRVKYTVSVLGGTYYINR